MGRIKGHYEWDDDELTPGQKKEGGLHQNLFDSSGNLRGSARFVPSGDDDDEPFFVTESVYVPTDQRRKTREQEALEEAIAGIIAHLVDRGVAKARRELTNWYRETGRPAIDARRAKLAERRARRRALKDGAETEEFEAESTDEIAALPPEMSLAEAQARFLAALAARAYSDEQVRLIMSSDIIGGNGDSLSAVERSLADLPAGEMKVLLEKMVADPSMLSESTLAELASVLGRSHRKQLE